MSDSAYRDGQPDTSIDAAMILQALVRALPRIIFITLLLCAAGYAILLFVPKVYESRAELLVEPRGNPIATSAAAPGSEAYLLDTAAVASQIELIKSRDTIRAAIEALDLREEPLFQGRTDEQIIATIADNLVVTQERSSRLISVAYRSQDPDLAARLANGIAIAHVTRRAGQQISDTIETTGWLQEEIDRLRASVLQAERDIAEFRVTNGLFVGANNESLTNQQLSNYSSQIAAASERSSAAQSRAQLIRALLESGQSVIGVSDVQSSSVGQELSQQLAGLQGERAQQSATYLPNHPTIRALDAQIAEIENQIAAEGRRIAAALDSQARIEADLQNSLEAELDELKITAGDNTREGVTLAELEREATAQRELLNAYLLRLAESTARTDVNSALPDVRIVSEAAPPVRPASPQTTMILLAIGVASILLQVGALIFSELLSGRALVERRRSTATDEPLVAPDTASEDMPIEAHSEPQEAVAPVTILANAPDAETAAIIAHDAEVIEPAEQHPEPEHEPEEPVAVVRPAAERSLDIELEAVAASAIAGIERLLVIAAANDSADSQMFAERLSARLVKSGVSVAEIDAASGQQGIEPGLTDLVAEEADFGDIVHRAGDGQFAYVPWGQAARLTLQSDRPATLVEALSDIYECVVIVTGKSGVGSSLPMFAHTGARCLLVGGATTDSERVEREIADLGFSSVQMIALPEGRAEVA